MVQYSNRADALAQKLCYICGEAERTGVLDSLLENNTQLQNWWKKHQEVDEARVTAEMNKAYRPGMESEELAIRFIREAEAAHPVSDFHTSWFYRLARELVTERDRKIEERKRKKEFKEAALAKLSPEERKALGF